MVKDYKGKEGWLINIEIYDNTIQVIHKRREETLPVSPPTEQFYFDYEICFTFSRYADVLYAVNMKVTGLKFILPVNETFRIIIFFLKKKKKIIHFYFIYIFDKIGKIEKCLGNGNLNI